MKNLCCSNLEFADEGLMWWLEEGEEKEKCERGFVIIIVILIKGIIMYLIKVLGYYYVCN